MKTERLLLFVLALPLSLLAKSNLNDVIPVDTVWAANMVSFDLYTTNGLQFVAYYDANRMMAVASRQLGSREWTRKTLSSKLVWDSHNYVTLGIDESGFLHVAGNMHVNPLVYFRSTRPYDVTSLEAVHTMVGQDEEDVTYPKFFNNKDGSLLFSYRAGSCGNGNVLVNRYNVAGQRWERYLKDALFEGIEASDDRAAYHHFVRDSEGNFHVAWIWRWTPEVATSHQICYAFSPDLIHWKNAAGEEISLPFRPDDERVIVDPVPANGGSHNGRYQVFLTKEETPVVGYVKYDENGLTQFYLARPEGDGWRSRQISDWDFRWNFFGGGDKMEIGGKFRIVSLDENGNLVIDWNTEKGDSGRYIVDPDTLELVETLDSYTRPYPDPVYERLTDVAGLSVSLQQGKEKNYDEGATYVLKWEAARKSHGRHAPEVIPAGPLSPLVIYKLSEPKKKLTHDLPATPPAMNWKADWIHAWKHENPIEAPSPYFRKTFELEKPVAEGTVAITALGLYELWINGRRVGDIELAPGWTDYNTRVPYQQYDVTGFLKPGKNAIGVILANGWYAGRMFVDKQQFYGDFPELLFQLDVDYEDQSSIVVTSDASWKVAEGPIRASDFYDGETYDARMEIPGWNLPDFDSSEWASVKTRPRGNERIIELSVHEPVRVIEKLEPLEIWEIEPGRWAFDLGQNMVGRARITVPGEMGRTITIRFSEMLNKDRTLYTENYRSAKSTDYYICHGNGGFETWEPVFTFHGFRYVELSGLPPEVIPDSGWVTGIVMHNDMEQTGSFACSNPLLNQLQSNLVWGQKGNFLEVPTDCPQRNERLGWTGDAQVFCPTACFNFDTLDFFHKWMKDVRDAQRENGLVPVVVPDGFGKGESPAWGDAVAIIPWEVYLRFGDKRILEENAGAIFKWVEYMENDSPGYVRAERGYGDWLQPFPVSKNNRGDTNRSLIGTAYFARCADIAARVSEILGKPDDALRFTLLAENVRNAFTKTFWTQEKRLTSDTQTAYLLALAFDLLPESEVPSAVDNLLRLIDGADGHLRTGFVGTPLLNATLTRFGHLDLAYEILLKETYPGWLYSIHQGATTMWERWNSYSHEDGFGNVGMNSFNHYAYGAIGQWMYETVAGLAPDPQHPGYKHFFIQPQPGGDLTWANAELETAHGFASSGWRVEGDTLIIEATVPETSTATVIFPSGKPDAILWQGGPINSKAFDLNGKTALKIGPGNHTFMVPN
jgi:alpha-L-rhamnosidase